MRLSLYLLVFIAIASRADVFVREDIIREPSPERFSVCHGNGCSILSEVSLPARQWAVIVDSFDPPAESGSAERKQLRIAIAQFERFVGVATGTWADRGRNASSASGPQAEMDCIDESINTTINLTILARKGLMRHHEVRNRATRGWFMFGWPHTTAVIRDRTDGSLWAVDSWFLDNGKPPFIIPLKTWRAGWEPEMPSVLP